jgi:hypothetical protein
LTFDIKNTIDYPTRKVKQQESGEEIAIMCLYTPEALCVENEQSAQCDTNNMDFIEVMNNKCELAIDETNTAFFMSGVTTTAKLVYAGLIADDYTEEQYMCSALGGMRDTTNSKYSRVRVLREKYKADLVTVIAHAVLFPDDGNEVALCGCGDIFSNNAQAAFSVVDKQCATGYYSIAHEIGKCFQGMLSYKFHSTLNGAKLSNIRICRPQSRLWTRAHGRCNRFCLWIQRS